MITLNKHLPVLGQTPLYVFQAQDSHRRERRPEPWLWLAALGALAATAWFTLPHLP